MSTAELVIAQAIDHFNDNTSSHVKREEVLIQLLYRLLLLDPEVNSCGDNVLASEADQPFVSLSLSTYCLVLLFHAV